MSKRNQQALRAILDASDSTSEFLQNVIAAIEGLYSELEDVECPAGFEALDVAVQAFEESEEE